MYQWQSLRRRGLHFLFPSSCSSLPPLLQLLCALPSGFPSWHLKELQSLLSCWLQEENGFQLNYPSHSNSITLRWGFLTKNKKSMSAAARPEAQTCRIDVTNRPHHSPSLLSGLAFLLSPSFTQLASVTPTSSLLHSSPHKCPSTGKSHNQNHSSCFCVWYPPNKERTRLQKHASAGGSRRYYLHCVSKAWSTILFIVRERCTFWKGCP